ncbi:hypothetical protein AM587_10005274 [Phytophthora nicotianae]|uniref:DDE-1 domain-containing protein n=1 Tax=Phytophthora nicotianae TaxID=4792 RepID=A0A0W8CF63_PHYNI|nr:hypothetical protein AM587_10005274 [Phytophthora nicotianae]
MHRPRINGTGRQPRKYCRISVAYIHNKQVIDYIGAGNSLYETINYFYGELDHKQRRAKKNKLTSGSHKNIGSVMHAPQDEKRTVTCAIMYAKDVANDNGIPFAQFGASSTWIKLCLRRHKLSFCTRQGQTTTADAEEAAAKFRAEVLQIMIEKECTMVYNADQTAIFFEYLPRKTITSRGSKTVWVKKVRATAMLLGDSEDMTGSVLLLWDDFSGHWTKEVVDYAASINVILHKVPPRYTYVCQPADIAWNQPLKSRLHAANPVSKKKNPNDSKKEKNLQKKTSEAHKNHTQEDAFAVIAKLRAKYKEEAFKLKAPGRPIITESITACWSGLSTTTISNGFNKVGLLMDTRTVEEVLEPVSDIDATVEELVQTKASEDSVESDDDIDCIGDDSDGEPD